MSVYRPLDRETLPNFLHSQCIQTPVNFLDFLMVVTKKLILMTMKIPPRSATRRRRQLYRPSPEILWRNQNGRLQLACSINEFLSVMAMATSAQR